MCPAVASLLQQDADLLKGRTDTMVYKLQTSAQHDYFEFEMGPRTAGRKVRQQVTGSKQHRLMGP